jgi:hypothetical protein
MITHPNTAPSLLQLRGDDADTGIYETTGGSVSNISTSFLVQVIDLFGFRRVSFSIK